MKVLIVEDSEDMRFLLDVALKRAVPDIELRFAAQAEEVVKLGYDFKPEVAILDSLTGGPSATETAAVLRQRTPNLVVVSFSGMPQIDTTWADIAVEKGRDGIQTVTRIVTDQSPDITR